MRVPSLKALLLSAALAFTGCAPVDMRQPPKEPDRPFTLKDGPDDPVTKYALVVVGSTAYVTDTDLFWLNSTYVYEDLLDLGFKDENIEFVYADGNPDFDMPYNTDAVDAIRDHEFSDSEDHRATESNLERIVRRFSEKVDDNDVFLVNIMTHGTVLTLDMEGSEMYPHELADIIRTVKPGFGLLYVDACNSGSYIGLVSLRDYVVIASTQPNSLGIVGTDFSSSRDFIENLSDPVSDINGDGLITVREAFERSKVEGVEFMEDNPGIIHALEKGSVYKVNLRPTMYIGNDTSAGFYLVDLNEISYTGKK
ncbi:TPA: hypothetical protein HA265_01315 [Candidatus Woesearchaeota archaeon]|nr:hypothetical protein [Candidatus Woesearchaeota archaeon]